MARVTEIHVEEVGTVRELNVYQIRRLKRVRGASKAIAPFALAAGLTYQQFRSLPIEKQAEVRRAYLTLISPGNA